MSTTMLTSTPRTSHTRIPISTPSSYTTFTKSRRPSISNTMHWLSRSSTQSSTNSPYAPSKPTRISEPKLVRSIELIPHQQRSGVLGSGATIVRTPDEALRETGVRLTFDGKGSEQTKDLLALKENGKDKDKEKLSQITDFSSVLDEFPSPPNSPPLPPLPMPAEDEREFLEYAVEQPKLPRPTRSPPPPPVEPTNHLRSSLKTKHTASTLEPSDVPAMPVNVPSFPPPPPFNPILISDIPNGVLDPSKIIVTLETCTQTFRTTLETINSRPSHLSDFISALFPQRKSHSRTSSMYSNSSDDMATYRHHLTSQGLLSQASFNLHLFLDRPSVPYAHILTYLRASPGTPDCPELLPRATQLHSSSYTRLEALLELRDEAAYLGLDSLHKLCTDEIRLRHGPRLHTRGISNGSTAGSVQSMRASVYSLHTLLERVESDELSQSNACSAQHSPNEPVTVPAKSPPTPKSWEGPTRGRRNRRDSPSRSPPAGWI